MPFAIHCDEEEDVKVPRNKTIKNEVVPGVKQRVPLGLLSNGCPLINVIKPEHGESENFQQSSQCEETNSLYGETDETVIHNAHQNYLASQVHNNKPLELFEKETVIRPNYLGLSKIKPVERKFLIDWVVKIHSLSKLSLKCLFLSVVTIDRFLQVDVDIMECDLQLVGLASMCIASEFEDDVQKSNDSFRKTVLMYSNLSGYSPDELISMDNRIHEALGLTLLVPHYFVSLHLHFLENVIESAKLVYDWFNDCHETLAKYLLELSLQEYEFCHYLPSQLAAASLCLSLKLFGDCKTPIDVLWDSPLICFSRYTYNTLEPLVKKMCWLIIESETSIYKAVQKKYRATHIKILQAAETFFYEYDDSNGSPSTAFPTSRRGTIGLNKAFLSPHSPPRVVFRSSTFTEIIDLSDSP